ncbi:cytochrome c [bacterium SCSIO 12643]|nr:cytochrome c [bacterium SCSIO 12643]
MLSKKQARAFFLGGTAVTFLIFIGLTIFSLSSAQDQANHDLMTEEVVRGKEIWEKNNCMGCHTLMGEGAYYGPELTKVYDRRGEGMIKAILMSPVPWEPNGRKMVAYGFSEQEANDVIAFFKWVGEIDLNGFDRVVSPLAKENKNN